MLCVCKFHLKDVYKRQVAGNAGLYGYPVNGFHLADVFLVHRAVDGGRFLDEYGTGPVSYTHLDVYKRQAWSASMSRRQELPRQTGRRTMLESVCMIFPTVSEDWTAYGAMQLSLIHI